MIFRCLRENTPCLPAWWVRIVLESPKAVVAACLLATVILGWYTAANFAIDTNMTNMVSDELPFRKVKQRLDAAFPDLRDRLVVVVESDAPEIARAYQAELAGKMRGEKTLVEVFAPGIDPFFRENGLLFRELDQLYETADNLAQAQAMLALVADDLSLPGFTRALETFLDNVDEFADSPAAADRLSDLLRKLGRVSVDAAGGEQRYLSWQELMAGEELPIDKRRQFIVAGPRFDYSALQPAKPAIKAVQRIIDETAASFPGAKARITGDAALRFEDLKSVTQGVGVAFVASYVLVGVVLFLGLGSLRLTGASLLTLLVGLGWTLGFAMIFIGRLNMISVAFVVLFVGLGIDYSIQVCLRCRELMLAGLDKREALELTCRDLGNALLLCSVTTAIGFFAFVPTAYVGASELGLIAGTGMFLNFLANMTLLPAMLQLMNFTVKEGRTFSAPSLVASFPVRFRKPVLVVAGAALLASLASAPLAYFDANPINLSNPEAESVIVAKELFATEGSSLWTASVLAESREDARSVAARMEEQELVAKAVTIEDFAPDNQQEKLFVIEEMDLFLPPIPENPEPRVLPMAEEQEALRDFASRLEERPDDPAAVDLLMSLRRLLGTDDPAAYDRLRRGVLEPLAVLLTELKASVRAEAFELEEVPRDLLTQYRSEGLYRVQVFPSRDISKPEHQAAFVNSVYEVSNQATGPAVAIYEAGRAIANAFTTAVVIAVAAIAVFLALTMRSFTQTALTLIPLLAAIAYTVGLTVLAKLPFNFANIIVVPLILGIGIDYAIHLMERYRAGTVPAEELLRTSTARGVFFGAVTTIISFSSLSFSAHAGTSSMGLLLTGSVLLMIIATLAIFPALLSYWKQPEPSGPLMEPETGKED